MAASKELDKDDTPRRPRSDEMSEVAEYLASDDWQSRVARARLQRERVLAERARTEGATAPAPPEEPPAPLADGAFMRRAEEARLARATATGDLGPAEDTPETERPEEKTEAPAAAPAEEPRPSQVLMAEKRTPRRHSSGIGTLVLLILGATIGAGIAYLAILLLAPPPQQSIPVPAPVETGLLAPIPEAAQMDHAARPAPIARA